MTYLFRDTACWSKDQLVQYLHDQIDEEERFVLEHHLTDCPLCFHAIKKLTTTSPEVRDAIAHLDTDFFTRYALSHSPQLHLNSIASTTLSTKNKKQHRVQRWVRRALIAFAVGSVAIFIYKLQQGALALPYMDK